MEDIVQIAQARLVSDKTSTTAWIDLRPGVRIGAVVSLKGDDRLWTIDTLGRPTDPADVSNLGRRHRDIHGGLQ
jgi:hypothetical protein